MNMLPVMNCFRCPCSTFKWTMWPGKHRQCHCLDTKCWNYEVSVDMKWRCGWFFLLRHMKQNWPIKPLPRRGCTIFFTQKLWFPLPQTSLFSWQFRRPFLGGQKWDFECPNSKMETSDSPVLALYEQLWQIHLLGPLFAQNLVPFFKSWGHLL